MYNDFVNKFKGNNMSKIIIEIVTTEDAQRAQKVINTILGNTVIGNIEDPADGGPHHENEEPKKEVVKKPRKTTPKKAEPKAEEPEPEEVEEPEPEEVEEESTESSIDLKTLTATAKDAVGRTDRVTVKDVIAEYGEKLSVVAESDYAELDTRLKAL